MRRRWVKRIAGTIVLAGVYFCAAKIGLSVGVVDQVTAFWLPSGIALSAVLLYGYGALAGVWVGAFLANLTASEPGGTASVIAVGNSLEAAMGAWFLWRLVDFDLSLCRLRDVLGLVGLAALASTTVAATIGVTSLSVGGVHGWQQFGELWSTWWLGDAVGVLVVAPLVLRLVHIVKNRSFDLSRVPEGTLLVASSTVLNFIIFFGGAWTGLRIEFPLEYAIFPVIAWAALRFGAGMTAFLGLSTSIIAIWGAQAGLGATGPMGLAGDVLLLQSFVGIMTATGLVLSGAVSEQRLSEDTQRRQHSLLEAIAEGTSDAVFVKDREGRYLMINSAGAELVGKKVQDVLGRDDRDLFSAETAKAIMDRDQAVMASGTTATYEEVGTSGQGTRIYLSTKGPYRDHQSRVIGVFGISRDVTGRLRAERSARFLADAGVALAGVVDAESTLQKVARLAVPFFADWCVVDMVQPAGPMRRVAVAHSDAGRTELGYELARRYPVDPTLAHGPPRVLRTGRSEMLAVISDEFLVQAARDAQHLAILRELGLKSYLWVPLRARGKNAGVISFVTAESSRHYDLTDLAVAEELARRASIALENAQLYAELRLADRRKDEFLATLAHELRNPLAPLRNALEILKTPGVEPGVIDQARGMMDRQVRQLVRLVDDLLDVSRIMQGKIELRKERIDLAVAVEHAIETAQPAIAAAGHHLHCDLPREPLILEADPIRIAQAISNLLHNSAKYTEPGGRISISAAQENGEAIIRVRDTGVGIAADMLPRIFDLFVQGDRRHDRSQGGMGIGLTLVRSLAEIHGGRVCAQSDGPGQGSEFVLSLPLSTDQPTGDANEVVARVSRASRPRRILVVDDNADAGESLAMFLRLQGHVVRVAIDSQTALEAVLAEAPEVAFLDIGMPGMDGYELARRLRQQPDLQTMMLVALTGWGQEDDRRRTQEAGFDFHLTKPAEPEVLERLLKLTEAATNPP
jgi:PAS domain S-box-containing protein